MSSKTQARWVKVKESTQRHGAGATSTAARTAVSLPVSGRRRLSERRHPVLDATELAVGRHFHVCRARVKQGIDPG
ncbi:hypothetical protein BU14_0023s0032 [Porphyra umbilicalis]|uniref:Uncharacterized protein n=1 Tax=Porphyra umbilicalis TaxID=2786 RepID=A0A1X6PK46_PORUM|nr:hypothetical protein BU14_0023s0032 [Porphyra umbilicalis]|eukprot:OSX81227.1 hypothetical protein BU14_0023s0032 [Porphyra umbilicalis]